MKLALAQFAPELGKKEKNLEKISAAASENECDLMVFGELFLTGYMCRDHLTKLSESMEGESIRRIAGIANEHDTHIVLGMPERGEMKGQFFNSAVLVYPDESVERYRKMHLANFGPFEEHMYFGTGGELPVFETRFGKLGMLICFDVFFPELCKIYALKGADLLVHISASPSATRIFFEKVIEARAIENAMFFSFTNLVGTELNMVFWGGNAVIGPRGEVKAKGRYFQEEVVQCEIDLGDMSISREFRPTLRDTRIELFSELKRLLENDIRGAPLDE